MKDKELAFFDYKKIIEDSWTYVRLTEREEYNLCCAMAHAQSRLCGNYYQRMAIMELVYTSFLLGLDYTGPNWRKQ